MNGGRVRLLQPDGLPVAAQPTHAGDARRGLFSPDGSHLRRWVRTTQPASGLHSAASRPGRNSFIPVR